MNELLENGAAKAVLERFVPGWEGTPAPMRDMTILQLNDTPFVNLSEEEIASFNAALKGC